MLSRRTVRASPLARRAGVLPMNLDPIMEDKELPGPCKGRWCERPNDRFGGIEFSRCAFRKSYPDVMVVWDRVLPSALSSDRAECLPERCLQLHRATRRKSHLSTVSGGHRCSENRRDRGWGFRM